MKWLLARLKEKSTWLAIFTLAGLLGMKIEPELREHIINAILAVAAVAAFVFREKTRESETADPQLELPKIDLVGRSETVNPAEKYKNSVVFRDTRYRDPSDDQLQSPHMSPVRSDENGWNG